MKTVIIVGASSEIGCEISKKLAYEGYNLILTYNNSEEKTIKLKNELSKKYKINLSIIKLDLLSEDYENFKNLLIRKDNKLIVGMVYCAGYTPKREIFNKVSLQEVKKVFMINVIAAYEISGILAENMKNSDCKFGSIVFLSSQIASFGSIGISAYSASKGGLNSLGISLAKELGEFNIRVNIISPGEVSSNNKAKKNLTQNIDSIPLKRLCNPKDIANLVNFLFSEDSFYINGVNIPLNGGR